MNEETSALQTLASWWEVGRSGSDVNKLIVKYLEANYRQGAFMTAAELAQAIGVSQASITRFAMLLGFSGFSEWSKEMQAVIRLQLSATERLWYANHPNDEWGDRVLSSEQDHLQQLQSILQSERFHEFAEALAHAHRVVLASARASATLLPYAHYFLGKVRPNVDMVTAGDPLWDRMISEETPNTLVVALAFPRYPRVLIDWLRQIHLHGLPIATITDRLSSPVVPYGKLNLIVPVTSASLFDSYATPMVLLNLLVRQVVTLIPEESKKRLDQLETWDQAQHIYYQEDANDRD